MAKYAKSHSFDVDFLVFGKKEAYSKVIVAGFGCVLLDESHLSQVDWLYASHLRADAIVIDLLFPGFFAFKSNELLFRKLRALCRCLVIIDVLGVDSISRRLRNIEVNIVISPYVGADKGSLSNHWRHYLKGSKFVLLGSEFTNLPIRSQRNPANRVLVTCGGSDPNEFTIKVLLALNAIIHKLEIRVVVGPIFGANMLAKIERLVEISEHKIKIVNSPHALLNEMLWCDVAIATNGLTKYELAASATPALLLSIDEDHELVNKPFANMQTSIDLGIGVCPKRVGKEVVDLLANLALRISMAIKGRALVDGKGIERLFGAINKELSC